MIIETFLTGENPNIQIPSSIHDENYNEYVEWVTMKTANSRKRKIIISLERMKLNETIKDYIVNTFSDEFTIITKNFTDILSIEQVERYIEQFKQSFAKTSEQINTVTEDFLDDLILYDAFNTRVFESSIEIDLFKKNNNESVKKTASKNFESQEKYIVGDVSLPRDKNSLQLLYNKLKLILE